MTDPVQPAHPAEPASEPAWGAPQTAPSRWTTRKTLATVGVAVVIAAAGGGAIYAASGSTTGDHRGPGGPGMSMNGPGMNGPGGQNGPGGDSAGPMAALHGQFVVADGNGGYTTELTQTGTVTAVSADSITAKSADNYTHTYAIGSGTREAAGVKVGDTVSIRATDANGTSTATAVVEGTSTQPNDGSGRRNRMGGPGGMGGMGTNDAASDPNQTSSGPGQFAPGMGAQIPGQGGTTN